MSQNVRVICHVDTINGPNSGAQMGVSGYALDGSANFGTNVGLLSIKIDPTESNLQIAIVAAIQAVLEAAPWNMTFAANDIIQLI